MYPTGDGTKLESTFTPNRLIFTTPPVGGSMLTESHLLRGSFLSHPCPRKGMLRSWVLPCGMVRVLTKNPRRRSPHCPRREKGVPLFSTDCVLKPHWKETTLTLQIPQFNDALIVFLDQSAYLSGDIANRWIYHGVGEIIRDSLCSFTEQIDVFSFMRKLVFRHWFS